MNGSIELLRWYVDAGVEVLVSDTPIDRFEASRNEAKPAGSTRGNAVIGNESRAEEPATQAPAANPPTLPDESAIQSARELVSEIGNLADLKQAMESFSGCNLKQSARNLVFADGNPDARIMFVGEAPGREEDMQGLPFVGRSGQLLDRMLAAIGLDRTTAYISNVIPWRPPGNRTPTPQETEICRPFIERHIELANPDVLVLLGGASAKTLLKTTDGIMKIRGKWTIVQAGQGSFTALATLHPAYLLRQPAHKKLAWQDFLKIRQKLEE